MIFDNPIGLRIAYWLDIIILAATQRKRTKRTVDVGPVRRSTPRADQAYDSRPYMHE
jgi:hypothetical protein